MERPGLIDRYNAVEDERDELISQQCRLHTELEEVKAERDALKSQLYSETQGFIKSVVSERDALREIVELANWFLRPADYEMTALDIDFMNDHRGTMASYQMKLEWLQKKTGKEWNPMGHREP